MSDNINIESKEYFDYLNRIKDTIRKNQNKAIVVVNAVMIMTYYEIGCIINEKKVWGNKFVRKLSNDLKEHGKGYSIRNLQYMMKFSELFNKDEIVHQVGAQIPWHTLCEIIMNSIFYKELIK